MNQLTRFQPLLATVAKWSDVPASYPLWDGIAADDRGDLWVSLGTRRRTSVVWKVFGPDVRYLGHSPSWFDGLDRASFAGNRMAYVGYDNDRTAVLRIYRIDRRGVR